MFLLKKIITPFLMPVGLSILLFMGYGIWKILRGRASGVIPFVLAVLIWVLSSGPGADLLLMPLESDYYRMAVPAKADVIVLLGGGVHEFAPDLSGEGTPSGMLMQRLVTVARLQKRFNLPVIISGGRVHPHRRAESHITRRFLVDLGVPAQRIITDTRSRDTMENAYYTKQLCEQRGFRRPVLVTSAFHMRRALFCFDTVGLAVAPYAAGFHTWPGKSWYWDDFLPQSHHLAAASLALHEHLGLLYHRLSPAIHPPITTTQSFQTHQAGLSAG